MYSFIFLPPFKTRQWDSPNPEDRSVMEQHKGTNRLWVALLNLQFTVQIAGKSAECILFTCWSPWLIALRQSGQTIAPCSTPPGPSQWRTDATIKRQTRNDNTKFERYNIKRVTTKRLIEIWTKLCYHISMVYCKIAVSPLLAHWRYYSLALNHRFDVYWAVVHRLVDCQQIFSQSYRMTQNSSKFGFEFQMLPFRIISD